MLGYKFKYGFNSGKVIDLSLYKFTTWQPTTNIDGTREIVNEGSANNLTLYSGSGTSFNGTNQSVDYDPVSSIVLSGFNMLMYSGIGRVTHPTYNMWTQNNAIIWYDSLGTFKVHSYTKTYSSLVVVFTPTIIEIWYDGVYGESVISNGYSLSSESNIGQRGGAYELTTIKDFYIINEYDTSLITKAYEQPEQFYIDALTDNTCVLNMPMNDKGSTAHDYVSNTDYPKLNYTTDQNISNLQYGTQDLKLPHDDLGLRDGTITPWIKGDGVGEWSNSLSTNDIGQIFTIQLVFKRPILSENIYLLKGQNGISGIQLDLNRTWADSDIRLYIFNSSGSSAQTIPNVLDEYTHIIFTYDGTTLKGYKNGVYQGQVTIQLDTNSNPIFEGLVTPETLKLCEIRNDKALTQEEVATAYNDAVNKGLLA